MNQSFFLAIPFLINLLLIYFTQFWGFSTNRSYVKFGSFALIFWLFSNYIISLPKIQKLIQKNQIIFKNSSIFKKLIVIKLFLKTNSILNPIIYSFFLLAFILFPIQNLNYGDGIILLENIFLEGNIFGFQITLDEFLEGFIHSFFVYDSNTDPQRIYRIMSTLGGFVYLLIAITIVDLEKRRWEDSFLFLATGSVLLFYGYSENYTLTSVYLFSFLFLLRTLVISQQKKFTILIIATLAVIGALFHLVFGYLIFSLAYFCYTVSEPKKFLSNSIKSGLLGLFLILLFFSYFLFFSDPVATSSQTHILSPPYYPLKRMISTKHILEILGNLWFTSGLSLVLLSYLWFFQKLDFKFYLSQPKNKILSFAILGYLIHAFVFNPLLGYPADWDIMSFYSIPLIYLSYTVYNIIKNRILFFPIILYFVGFYLFTAISLHTNTVSLEYSYQKDMKIAKSYTENYKKEYQNITRFKKKEYLKLHYFLYKSSIKLQEVNSINSRALLKESNFYQEELKENTFNNSYKYDKNWSKDFFNKLTDYHFRYLKVLEEEKKYHPEKQ